MSRPKESAPTARRPSLWGAERRQVFEALYGSVQYAYGMQVEGDVEASAHVKGSLHPFVLSTGGSVNSGPVVISRMQLDSLRLKWSGDERQIKVPTLEARLYGGKVTGSAVVPMSDNQAGSAELRLDDVQLEKIAQKMGGLPVRTMRRAASKSGVVVCTRNTAIATIAPTVEMTSNVMMRPLMTPPRASTGVRSRSMASS